MDASIFAQLLLMLICMGCGGDGADLDIQVPAVPATGRLRFDYKPPHGSPPANSTFPAADLAGDGIIHFSNGLPGTPYDFAVYYSNDTGREWLLWTASNTTVPDPVTNLTVTLKGGKAAQVTWDPPALGKYTNFKLKMIPLSEPDALPRYAVVEEGKYTLANLTPGASYQVQLLTVYDGKESLAYTSTNFTTKPNTPGKFIVWFRNETTLLVLWQPPYPAGLYTHYKVSIDPSDGQESVLYVEREGEPPGPAQAAFKGLVPGRAYNISVQTVSEDETSTPTTAQYRTVPLRPLNVTFDKSYLTSRGFRVRWESPKGHREFDKYQVSMTARRAVPVTRLLSDPLWWDFRDSGLEPGRTYQVVVKTVSGKVTSWPASGNVTLKPLPVSDIRSVTDSSGIVNLTWTPNNSSYQDGYKITYHEVETLSGDSNTVTVSDPWAILESLLPGRNYSISVQALSGLVEGNETELFLTTRPLSPIIEELRSLDRGLSISWKSDVKTRQDQFEVQHERNDTNETFTTVTSESHLILKDLYPGAGYLVKVYATSHGLRSEPHGHFRAVYPNPPGNLTIEKVSPTSVLVRWSPPNESIFQEYTIQYRTTDVESWQRLPAVHSTEAEIADLTPGEQYLIQVNTASYGLESLHPLEVEHHVFPSAVTNLVPLVDSTNVTLEFPRPEGRIEHYEVTWDSEVSELPPGVDLQEHTKEYPDNPTQANATVRILVADLFPGVKHWFSVRTESFGLASEKTRLHARTMPLLQSDVLVAHDKNALAITYTPTPQSVSRFTAYRFSLGGDETERTLEKQATDPERKVRFENLVPGRLYNITAWTVADDNVLSRPLVRAERLIPEPITELNSSLITDHKIGLIWSVPNGDWDYFQVLYLDSDDVLHQNETLKPFIELNNLRPYHNYTFTVAVNSGSEASLLRMSTPLSRTFETQESVPGMPTRFAPIDVQPSEISFEWSLPPERHNGNLLKFSIKYNLESSSSDDILIQNFGPDERKGVINELSPGKTYIFRLHAATKMGLGPEFIWKQTMPILPPPKPSNRVVPTEVRKSTTTIQIRFRKNYFSEQNGDVIAYTIIVAEDHSKNASGLEMPSWRDVQDYSLWPPYQVMEPYYPFKNSSIEDFTIGTESCDLQRANYCNGPLKPGSTYRVKVRAFTAPDKFTDTAYSFSIQTDTDNTAIWLISVVVLLSFLFVVGGIYYFKKRISHRRAMDARHNDSLSLPDSVIETSRPIRLDQFAEHYRQMSADSDFRFSEEFEELKHAAREQVACTAADLPVNRPKNRFTNILPYDHSRFKLQPVDDEEGSDYINANYVPGHNSPREFLVTQGPLHSTRDDFWRMCWESNSRAIVMLTRCIEKGREKCDHYWPYDTLPVYYGDICVTILNDSHYPDWSITEFLVCRGEQSRVIRHFHFTTWPDFGVPSPPQTLVRFVRAFRERVGPDQRPVVVHCSAGVGRSGTFIALDRLIQQIEVSDHVDIFGLVVSMRKERVWMVQTEQQYICIHQCLLAVLEGEDSPGPTREVHHNPGFEDDEGIAESGM